MFTKTKKMKKLLTLLLLTISLSGFTQQTELTWHTNVDNAVNLSVESGKPLFFFFTGSDWCGWCKKLQKDVFFKDEFKKWAKKSVILVELDFPRRTKLDETTQKQNRKLAGMFGVRGYPTIKAISRHTAHNIMSGCKKGLVIPKTKPKIIAEINVICSI